MLMKKTGKPDVGLSGDFYSHSMVAGGFEVMS